ncbi:MAG: N-acetyl-gamma-glutamyl-phosphate reductase [Spirochaetes bacterium]|nr:N-acetyl-gamma-glutamyl-phosphate reductase [Spirochaetota bacterium]
MIVTILGVTGYAGTQLLKLLLQHPEVEEVLAVSSSQNGKFVLDEFPALEPELITKKMQKSDKHIISMEKAVELKSDIVFSALPHLKSAEVLQPFYQKSIVLDLSADFRMNDEAKFNKAYGSAPLFPEQQKRAVYGLCEWFTEDLYKTNLIAVPGCYPTATLLPLLPLVKNQLIEGDIIINALSGITGAGKKAQNHLLFCERQENMTAYLPGMSHRHAYEIEEKLEEKGFVNSISFTPHLIPLRRGIFVTTATKLKSGKKQEDIKKAMESAYDKKKCIRILQQIPQAKDVWGTNRCDMSFHLDGAHLILFSVIDNLMKGAAGQAVQCMNIRLGLPETTGLPLNSPF